MVLNCGVGEDSWESPARRSNQSILKKISPEYSLEGLLLKLKLQYFGHLMRRSNSLEKILMLGKIEGGRRRGWQRMSLLDGITNWMDMSLSKAFNTRLEPRHLNEAPEGPCPHPPSNNYTSLCAPLHRDAPLEHKWGYVYFYQEIHRHGLNKSALTV